LGDGVWLGPRGGGALCDPSFQQLNLVEGQLFSFWWHFPLADEAQHFALFRLAGHDRKVAALPVRRHEEAPEPDIQASLKFLPLPVAVDAVVFEPRADVSLKGEGSGRALWIFNGFKRSGNAEPAAHTLKVTQTFLDTEHGKRTLESDSQECYGPFGSSNATHVSPVGPPNFPPPVAGCKINWRPSAS